MSNSDFPLHDDDLISYHFEDVDFDFHHSSLLSSWLKAIIHSKNKELGFLNYIFCTDNYLHKINVKYLEHDTLTDVITFPYSDDQVEGDIFISIQRVKDNSKELGLTFESELHRVMIHGLLHLLGLNDKSLQDKEIMTKKENECLSVLNGMILDNT